MTLTIELTPEKAMAVREIAKAYNQESQVRSGDPGEDQWTEVRVTKLAILIGLDRITGDLATRQHARCSSKTATRKS